MNELRVQIMNKSGTKRKHTIGVRHTTGVFLLRRVWVCVSAIDRFSHPGLVLDTEY